MESMYGWQVISLCGIALWIVISSNLRMNQKLRSFTQPWVSCHVVSGTPIIIKIQDVVSAPRPKCPPFRRVTATKDEEDNAMEYGLPSSHTLNTICLSGYLLHYILDYTESNGVLVRASGFALVCLIVGLIRLGRIYLGMHSLLTLLVVWPWDWGSWQHGSPFLNT